MTSKKQPQKKSKSFTGRILRVLLATSTLLVAIALGLMWALHVPINRKDELIDAYVPSGMGARAIAQELRVQGLMVEPNLFVLAARLTKKAGQLKAGRYVIPPNLSTLELVRFLSIGKGLLNSVTLVEGLTSVQMIAQLRLQSDLQDDLVGLSETELAKQFNLQGNGMEGWLYPDTYRYAPGSKLSEILGRAIRLQQKELAQAWANRLPDLPLKTPYEALILASIIEKETGLETDRPRIASVFVNRLNRKMLLQTDPAVIYGVENFDGNLTKNHLKTDTPYNTYTRVGLPPTPISNPGKASLYAAVRPEKTDYLYFVAQGNGSSYFSRNLNEHNHAVRRYILRRSN